MKKTFHILLGTNIGDRHKNLATALLAIDPGLGRILKKSSVYLTVAWGKTDQEPFYNQVVELKTSLAPHDLLQALLQIEQNMGRSRRDTWGERIIDLDILLYGKEVIETRDLVIPHPRMANRRFTLVPLNEIASEFNHPVYQKRIAELLQACPDTLSVVKLQ